MIVLRCPRDDEPLTDSGNRAYRCPRCHWDFVVSITDAYHAGSWNRRASHASAVLAVMEATEPPRRVA